MRERVATHRGARRPNTAMCSTHGGGGGMTRARMPRPHEIAAARRDPRLLRAIQEQDRDETWRARGLCKTVDPEIFFPAASEPADRAVALCRLCDVQGACLASALRLGDC